jgi:hypothetical protein
LACLAAGVLCGTGLPGTAVANPPHSAGRSWPATVRQENSVASQLDLRPPVYSMPVVFLGRFAPGPHSGLGTNEPIARPGFGTREADFPLMSRPETWLHRVHREGVPIVRLWNSKSALLSIGLNQKGKPGLWLIQKIH